MRKCASPQPAQPCKMEYRDGVTKDGRIIARKVRSLQEAGAYHRHSPYGAQKHMANLPGPYNIPNVWVDVYCVYTNRQPSSAMRGFGVTEASFAIEVQMDKIARAIGMDPWEIRLINAYRNGQMKPVRKIMEDATLIETLQAAAKLVGHELSEQMLAMNSDDYDTLLSYEGLRDSRVSAPTCVLILRNSSLVS